MLDGTTTTTRVCTDGQPRSEKLTEAIAGVYEARKSLWASSLTSAVHRGLRNPYFAERGLVSLVQ